MFRISYHDDQTRFKEGHLYEDEYFQSSTDLIPLIILPPDEGVQVHWKHGPTGWLPAELSALIILTGRSCSSFSTQEVQAQFQGEAFCLVKNEVSSSDVTLEMEAFLFVSFEVESTLRQLWQKCLDEDNVEEEGNWDSVKLLRKIFVPSLNNLVLSSSA